MALEHLIGSVGSDGIAVRRRLPSNFLSARKTFAQLLRLLHRGRRHRKFRSAVALPRQRVFCICRRQSTSLFPSMSPRVRSAKPANYRTNVCITHTQAHFLKKGLKQLHKMRVTITHFSKFPVPTNGVNYTELLGLTKIFLIDC